MKAKLLKRLRKRFRVVKKDGYYYAADYGAIGCNFNYPYYYEAFKEYGDAVLERNNLILTYISYERGEKIIL